MKNLAYPLLALLITGFQAQANSTIDFEGRIASVFMGEIDPALLGDICIVNLKTADGYTIGLVTDYDQCREQESDLRKNRELAVAFDRKNLITDRKALNLLSQATKAAAYYRVDFGTIENGLADEVCPTCVTRTETLTATLVCEFQTPNGGLIAGVSKNQFSPTGYDFFAIEKVTTEMLYRGHVRNVDRKADQMTLTAPEGQLTIFTKGEITLTIELRLQQGKTRTNAQALSCKENEVIPYQETIVLEPRLSVGN